MLKELIILGLASIGGYFTYGLFAENIGSIIKIKERQQFQYEHNQM